MKGTRMKMIMLRHFNSGRAEDQMFWSHLFSSCWLNISLTWDESSKTLGEGAKYILSCYPEINTIVAFSHLWFYSVLFTSHCGHFAKEESPTQSALLILETVAFFEVFLAVFYCQFWLLKKLLDTYNSRKEETGYLSRRRKLELFYLFQGTPIWRTWWPTALHVCSRSKTFRTFVCEYTV